MARITLNFWAGARAAAGTASVTVDAETIASALAGVTVERPDDRLTRVLAASSLLVDGIAVAPDDLKRPIERDGVVVEVLPPFAGG